VLVGKADWCEAGVFGVSGKCCEIDVGGDVPGARGIEWIVACGVTTVGAESAFVTGWQVVVCRSVTVIEEKVIAVGKSVGCIGEPGSLAEIDFGGVVFWEVVRADLSEAGG